MKPPLVDFWADFDEVEKSALGVFAAFCASMPDSLACLEQLRFNGAAMTPKAVLDELRQQTPQGQRLAREIGEAGIVPLLKPNEARFRK